MKVPTSLVSLARILHPASNQSRRSAGRCTIKTGGIITASAVGLLFALGSGAVINTEMKKDEKPEAKKKSGKKGK